MQAVCAGHMTSSVCDVQIFDEQVAIPLQDFIIIHWFSWKQPQTTSSKILQIWKRKVTINMAECK